MSVPPRLFVVLAREAPIGVILRRGPAAWYHVILWHTDTDHFERGAWFKGRIYEERCDLSPDGQLFLYFALQGSCCGPKAIRGAAAADSSGSARSRSGRACLSSRTPTTRWWAWKR
jgi:hypothetical protein